MKTIRKVLALFCALAMLFSCVLTGVSAEQILENLKNYPMDQFSMNRDGSR